MFINNRLKKLIGTIIIPIWLILFIGIIATLAEEILPNLNGFYVFLFYLIGGLIFTALFIIFITNFQIKPEEKVMLKIFGEEFVNYKDKVRRWL